MSFGTSTPALHSSRHILQLTHSDATARIASPSAVVPSSSSRRSRFALARGVAVSRPVVLKTGHMRSTPVRGRQSPQPLHFAASLAGEVSQSRMRGFVSSRETGLVFEMAGIDTCVSLAVLMTSRLRIPVRIGSNGQAGRVGSGPTILPGLSTFFGSKMRFTSRKRSPASANCFRTHGVRLRPTPCCGADRAAEFEHESVHRIGERPEFVAMVRRMEIDERAKMHNAGR